MVSNIFNAIFDNILLILGIIFVLAFITKFITKGIKIPEVTGYVILGVLVGIGVGKLLNHSLLDSLLKEASPISTIALGMIAFIIGIELKWSVIKKLGKSILMIVIFESFGAFLVVVVSMSFLMPDKIYQAILLGSVAAATAPAATIAVIKQYKSQGPLTSTIIAVVGIDDAVALIIYVFASSFANSFILGSSIHIMLIVGKAFLNVFLSLALGGGFALIYMFILKNVRDNDWIKQLITAFILILLGVSEILHLSELLAIMTFGALIVNFSPSLANRSTDIVSFLSPIFLTLFFIFGGAHLDISLIGKVGIVGLIYFAARSIGKISGASIGATIGGAQKKVKKFIGFALLPQVGVALALALSINKQFNVPKYGTAGHNTAMFIINILLFTTIITEVIGPILTKFVLTKAGEISKK